jgi:hypothetical protein
MCSIEKGTQFFLQKPIFKIDFEVSEKIQMTIYDYYYIFVSFR